MKLRVMPHLTKLEFCGNRVNVPDNDISRFLPSINTDKKLGKPAWHRYFVGTKRYLVPRNTRHRKLAFSNEKTNPNICRIAAALPKNSHV